MTSSLKHSFAVSDGFARWNVALADAFCGANPKQTFHQIGDGLSALFDATAWYIIFFRHNEPPILYDYSDAETRKDSYEDGPYLLDPFYTSFLRGDPQGVYLKRDISPRDFSDIKACTEYHCEFLGPTDEIGLVFDFQPDTRAFICISRVKKPGASPFYSKHHVALLESIAPILQGQIWPLWEDVLKTGTDTPDRLAKHSRITTFFASFGRDRLTEREAEVGNLMIKGFNAREVAGLLDISYGTARNHMKKVYLKLQVSSQNELCGLFIEQLLDQG